MVVEKCFWISDTLQKLWSKLLWKWCLCIIWYLKTLVCIPYNLQSWTYWWQTKLWDRWFLIKILWTIQLPVWIVYNGCGGVFLNIRYSTEIMIIVIVIMMSVEHLYWKTLICILYSLSTLRDFVKSLFNKSFFFTSIEVPWEYNICLNSLLSRQKSSPEMIYLEQLKHIRLVKNITSLMIKAELSFCLFEPILILIDSLPVWALLFSSFIVFFEEVLNC